MAYSKLHSSLINSSLWTESDHVRLLFITLLAMCDKDGCVYGSRSGLSRAAMIDPDACEEQDPWHVLMSPDPESCDRMRAPEHEGRRIEEIPGGFRLLNFAYYRGLRNDDDRREQNRLAQERFKSKQSHRNPPQSTVSHGKPRQATVSRNKPPKAHTETEADTETEAEKNTCAAGRGKVKSAIDIPDGIDVGLWHDWIAVRKSKRAGPVTQTVINGITREAAAAGLSLSDAIKTATERGWASFKADWLIDGNRNGKPANGKSFGQRAMEGDW